MKKTKRFTHDRAIRGFRAGLGVGKTMESGRRMARGSIDPAMAAAGGLGIGAMLAYLLDPERGSRRRALARDRAEHMLHKQGDLIDKGTRDASQRARGLLHRVRNFSSDEPSDDILLQRVRARLGRRCSHPSAVRVEVRDGAVTLRGPILSGEAGRLVRAVGRVRGVHTVEDAMEHHETPEDVPELQGGSQLPRPVLLREHWTPALRLAAMGSGLAAVGYGVVRGGLFGSLVGTAGGLAALRGMSDRSLRTMFGVRSDVGAVVAQKTITVDRPIEEVYEFWANLENFPKFMDHVEDVTVGDSGKRSHWEVVGPAGTTVEWDAELIEAEPHERLVWHTVGRSAVEHAGAVRFQIVDQNRTRVHVRLAYTPPAGAVGHAVASLLGHDPKRTMDKDLSRMKSLLESGKTTAHGQEVTVQRLH